ncbi:hypothetical protein HF086_012761 [Spodoptera exigua]|uniref:Uncharacterized protein n=1 Tax=Spodoptera exigua TaxID=7107 RepID=A0A922MW61_SPOEX|nr:hypothetical protein HF086_012761 [Spodoptera exigua]
MPCMSQVGTPPTPAPDVAQGAYRRRRFSQCVWRRSQMAFPISARAVTKRFRNDLISNPANICYKHNDTHFYSKISFFWLNSLLKKGYKSPLEPDYLGELPEDERSVKYYKEFLKIYKNLEKSNNKNGSPSLLSCYIRKVWPNFYIAGVLKLFGDLIGVVPPLGLAVIIQYIQDTPKVYDSSAQSMVYDKCMRLAPWSTPETCDDEETRLLHDTEDSSTTRTGLITNLVSQDTYNIMSCVWICHYIWAIPLKVVVILYLLYTKLGISAIIGTAVSVLVITPLQFYIGKKLSDNSKDIAKCTDHRLSKMAEILHGMDVIKLYVWEDLFKEKILQLRELELKLLNKDSAYWSILTFTTQISSIIITVVTFTVYYFIDSNSQLTATNVFAGLAFFNQLTVPLLILPVTVLMVIQAMVSTKRITDFLELPESNNVNEENLEDQRNTTKEDRNQKIDKNDIDDHYVINNDEQDGTECVDQFSDDEVYSLPARKSDSLVTFRNAAFSWGKGSEMSLEVDDLDIPAEGDATRLGSHGAPLSGGQRIRVCVARALYSDARLLALDEPLAALDAPLARHLVARALVPAARAGRTVLVATNRLELLHYADLIIAMEEGRVSGVGRGAACEGALARWARLAGEARAVAARAGAGPPGGTARERSRLVRALSRSWYQRCNSDETTVGISEAAGAHLLSEVPTCAGGSWRRRVSSHSRPALSRQLSSPPPSMYNSKWRPDVRRAVSADESNAALQREASLLRRLLKPRGSRTINRWTPKTLRRLISSDSETVAEDNQNNDVVEDSMVDTPYSSLTSNGIETNNTIVADDDDPDDSDKPEDVNETWSGVRTYALWCGCGALAAGAAQAGGAAAAVRARRALHDRLLHATLRAPPHHLRAAPLGDTLHRFSADILDLVGAGCVCVVLGVCLQSGAGGAVAGLAGAYALLLPAYLAHLAKCRADLHLQLAALERVHADTCAPQEDYRDDCECHVLQ